MADVHSSATRSKNMRAIRTRDTAIEQRMATLLETLQLPFGVQQADLPGRPDFVLAESRAVIFTHGCFWHRHHCHLFRVPATRTAFWLEKISANVARDRRDRVLLNQQGWRVLVVWECALRSKTRLSDAALLARLEEWICAGDENGELDSGGLHNRVDLPG